MLRNTHLLGIAMRSPRSEAEVRAALVEREQLPNSSRDAIAAAGKPIEEPTAHYTAVA
jgi:hypothetical protein